MSYSLDCLRQSSFWKKKIHAAVLNLDVDKNGVISCSDIDLIIQHYKQNGSSPEHVRALQESFEKLHVIWGMTDKNTEFTIDE